CHDSLAFHGGSRKGVDLCIMCHTPQTTNPDTGNTVDMPVMTHAIHIGQSFPTIENAAKPYQIFSRGSLSDWQTVVYPADVRNCAKTCHNPKNGAAQTNSWLTTPTRAACGACHSNINFATGLNHVNLPQVDDKQCAGCHIPQGELEFDASIIGGHTIPAYSLTLPGINVTLVKVIGAAGAKPVVSFTVKDNSGAGIPMSKFTSGGSLSMSMTGSTSDYGSVSFGTDTASTPGYVTESVAAASQCDNGGNCTYTFTHAIPAAAKGTYAIGVEARLSATLLPGTTLQQTNELKSRMQMTDVVNRRKIRHAHMVNINKRIMLEGMRADFQKVDRLSVKVMETVRRAKQIRAKTPAGTDLVADLNPNYRWVKTSGIISTEKWGNLPGGEVFTTPGEVNGTFVIDGV